MSRSSVTFSPSPPLSQYFPSTGIQCPQGQKKRERGRGKSSSMRAWPPPVLQLGALCPYRSASLLKGLDLPSLSRTPAPTLAQSLQLCPRTGPPPLHPAASRPFTNEGTAAGHWETDGPPHLNGFDLATQASASSGLAGPEITFRLRAQIHSPRGL